MSIFTSVFEEDGILMAWGDCPYQYEDGERCEGDILEVCQDMDYHWKCSATISHGFFYSERDRLNIREANKMEVEAYQLERKNIAITSNQIRHRQDNSSRGGDLKCQQISLPIMVLGNICHTRFTYRLSKGFSQKKPHSQNQILMSLYGAFGGNP